MKLLICDDDISNIDVIQNEIDWGRLGIRRILRAYNGLVGKDLIEKEKPDLILCDIGMPQCDGIEVLRFVHEKNLGAIFTFLTCYETFEYAREAMRYGAMDYLTKPFELDELYTVLERMVAVAKAKKDTLKKQEELSSSDTWINHILRSLRDGFYGDEKNTIEAMLKKENTGLEVDSKWRLIMVTADMKNALEAHWGKDLLQYSFRYLMQEVIADRLDFSYMLADGDDRSEMLTIFLKASELTEKEVQERCEKFIAVCQEFVNMEPLCVVGEEFELYKLADVASSLKKRAHTLRLQQSRVFSAKSVEEAKNVTAMQLDEMKILSSIKNRNKEEFMATVSEKVSQITQGKEGSDKQIALLHHDLLQCFYTCLRDNHIQANQIFSNEIMQQLAASAERSVFDMMKYAAYLFDQTTQKIQALSSEAIALSSAKQYIQEHFRENIDRNDIAAVAFITPNYLSKKFHIETGLTLREYINQLRIEEAKRLLLTTDATISDIASVVGFDNISYFSTVFRKMCGISPIDWRNNAKN